MAAESFFRYPTQQFCHLAGSMPDCDTIPDALFCEASIWKLLNPNKFVTEQDAEGLRTPQGTVPLLAIRMLRGIPLFHTDQIPCTTRL